MTDSKDVDEFIDSLMHAKVYDPTKAHEYYLKTRELKGRKTGANVVEAPLKGKQAKVALNSTRTRKARVDAAAARLGANLDPKKQAQVTALSNKAKAELTKLTEALGQWADKARADHAAAKSKASASAEAKIKALPALPKSAGAGLKAQRAKNISQIRADAIKSLDGALEKQIEAKRNEVKAQKDVVVENLKTAVKKLAGNAAS